MLMLCLGASFLFAFVQATNGPTPTSQPAAVPALPQVAPPAAPKDAPTPFDPKERLALADKIEVLAGPPMLQQAALDAVRKWVYQPYLLDGRPVEVETDITVVFNLGR